MRFRTEFVQPFENIVDVDESRILFPEGPCH